MAGQYDQRPEMALESGKSYSATVEMENGGSFVIDLFADDAPETVNSFVFLAGEGYYEGIMFHRVIPGFVAQGGDPTGTGTGGPGYTVPDEVNDHKHEAGAVAMAKTAAPDSAGSQFYVALDTLPHLDGGYTVFGKVREGLDVVLAIPAREPSPGADPGEAIKTVSIAIE